MTLSLTGLTAMQLIASEGIRSVVVDQRGSAAVKSLVCQMPPLTVAANTCLLLAGSTASMLTAPVFRLPAVVGPIESPELVMEPGPSVTQSGTPVSICDW